MRMHARLQGLSAAARLADRETMFLLLENRSFGYPGTDGGTARGGREGMTARIAGAAPRAASPPIPPPPERAPPPPVSCLPFPLSVPGTLWSNYVAYCLNRHPLISIVCAHPLHPFTRPERFVILLCSFCWAFYLNSLMHFPAIRSQHWVVRYTILALLVIPYEILIRVVAVCSCVQYDDSEHGQKKRRCFQASGHLTLFFVVCLNLVRARPFARVPPASPACPLKPPPPSLPVVRCAQVWVAFGVLETIGAPVYGVSRIELGYSTVLIKVYSLLLWFPQWIFVFLLW